MFEFPLMLVVIGIGLAILLPLLPPLGKTLALGVAVLPVLRALFYMIVAPGWTPEAGGRGGKVLRWVVFLGITGGCVAGVLTFALSV
jgi:hypothetical protein